MASRIIISDQLTAALDSVRGPVSRTQFVESLLWTIPTLLPLKNNNRLTTGGVLLGQMDLFQQDVLLEVEEAGTTN